MACATEEPVDSTFLFFKSETRSVAGEFAKNYLYIKNGLIKEWKVRKWNFTVGGKQLRCLNIILLKCLPSLRQHHSTDNQHPPNYKRHRKMCPKENHRQYDCENRLEITEYRELACFHFFKCVKPNKVTRS